MHLSLRLIVEHAGFRHPYAPKAAKRFAWQFDQEKVLSLTDWPTNVQKITLQLAFVNRQVLRSFLGGNGNHNFLSMKSTIN